MHPNILEDTIRTVRSTFDAAEAKKNNEDKRSRSKIKRYSMVHCNTISKYKRQS